MPIPRYRHPGRHPWNKGKLIGAKPPLRQKHVWAIRTKLQIEQRTRDLAMFNLAIDSKLRGCDVVAIRVEDVAPSGYSVDRATVRQKKTGRPVRFELTEVTRQAVGRLHQDGREEARRVLVYSRTRAGTRYEHAAVRAARLWVDCQYRAGPTSVWPPFPQANQGDIDLSADRQPAGRSATARPYQD